MASTGQRNKIDSNNSVLRYIEEPVPSVASSRRWKLLEPSGIGTFGGTISTFDRRVLRRSRSAKRGGITQFSAACDFQVDMLEHNLEDLLQGFFFTRWVERGSTERYGSGSATVTAVTTSAYTTTGTTAANGWDALASSSGSLLVYARGFTNAANNGLKAVSAINSTSVTTSGLAAETTAPTAARLDVVGIQGASGVIGLSVSGGVVSLTGVDAKAGIKSGEWIYLGGDAAITKFSDALSGWCRVKSVSGTTVTLDITDFAPATDAGSSKTIQIFTACRYLREGADDEEVRPPCYLFELEAIASATDNTYEAKYVTGAIGNTLNIGISTADRITCSLGYLANDARTGIGTSSTAIESRQTGVPAPQDLTRGEIFNTSDDIRKQKLYAFLSSTTQQADFYTYLSDASVSINNNVTPLYAIGQQGAFDHSFGDFTVDVSATAFFKTFETFNAVRRNVRAGQWWAYGRQNFGVLIDAPSLQITGATESFTIGSALTASVTARAVGGETDAGHALQYAVYDYLPSIANA